MDNDESRAEAALSPFACTPEHAPAYPTERPGGADAETAMLASLAAYVASQATPTNGVASSGAPFTLPGGDGKRGGVMNEVFVLGKLVARPLHGYLLRQIMSVALGPVRQMNWNTLYPLIHRLVSEGLIEPVDDADAPPFGRHGALGEPGEQGAPDESAPAGEGGRRRKAYRITPAGQARFQELMRETEGYTPDYPDLFNVKLSNFAYVAPATRVAILRHYQGYLQLLSDYIRAIYTNTEATAGIPDGERPYIRRMIQHRWYLTQADLRWIGEAISHEMVAYGEGLGK